MQCCQQYPNQTALWLPVIWQHLLNLKVLHDLQTEGQTTHYMQFNVIPPPNFSFNKKQLLKAAIRSRGSWRGKRVFLSPFQALWFTSHRFLRRSDIAYLQQTTILYRLTSLSSEFWKVLSWGCCYIWHWGILPSYHRMHMAGGTSITPSCTNWHTPCAFVICCEFWQCPPKSVQEQMHI